MHLQSQESIEDNLRFLIKEVQWQVRRARTYSEAPSRALRKSMVGRDDYIDNLRTFIQRACFQRAANHGDIEYLKALDIIAVNLERIADFCESLIDQIDHLPRQGMPQPEEFAEFFAAVEAGLEKVELAVVRRDVRRALEVAEAEPRLDQLYANRFARGLAALSHGGSPQTEVTLIFIWHYFERMGDSLLNIGEAVVSAVLGEKIKIGQLWALQDSLRRAGSERSIDDVQLVPVGESRSGARITRVAARDHDPSGDALVIFKEGKSGKVHEEHDAIARWESLVPGIAPKAYSVHDGGPNSAMLLEYLPGITFEDAVLQGPPERTVEILGDVMKTLAGVWDKTRVEQPAQSHAMDQLRARLAEVLNVHPSFAPREVGIGGIQVLGLNSLVDRAGEIEAGLHAPFSVLTHGDLNVDNVIVARDQRIRFIDLHRSALGDYAQDVSVFIVSNLRLQIFESHVRRNINAVVEAFYGFACEFATRRGDTTFGVRLALGLARSFATSTRFLLDEAFAKSLLLRARYLLERVVQASPEEISTFEVPREVLID